MKATHIDTLNFLNYWAQITPSKIRTANLRTAYHKFANFSGYHAPFVHIYLDYLNYWCHSTHGITRIMNFITRREKMNLDVWRYVKFYDYISADYQSFKNLDATNNNDCDIAKVSIRDILKKYDELFINFEYPVSSIQSATYVKPPYQPWEEKYKAITYQKGYRGAVSKWLSHWYI